MIFLAFSNVGLLTRKALSVKCLMTNDQTTTKHLQFKSVYSIVTDVNIILNIKNNSDNSSNRSSDITAVYKSYALELINFKRGIAYMTSCYTCYNYDSCY